jgi:ribonuclease-3
MDKGRECNLTFNTGEGRQQTLQELEERLKYQFQKVKVLEQALIHSSYSYEFPETGQSNERLEFLGDAVLALIISDLLIERFPGASEGKLSRRRASLVNARQLAQIAQELNLGASLLLGRGEEQQEGRQKQSVLANALEAVLAAVYLDGGLEAARRVIQMLFTDRLQQAEQKSFLQDFKTLLQEYTQKHFKIIPTYQVLAALGAPHARTFEVEVWLEDKPLAQACGRSKKQAAQAAARLAIEYLKQVQPEGRPPWDRIKTEGQKG